ncbi:MAG: serine/threonine-protein phosphatase [Lachnospiraceae bacterium]|nr:serine/threonine-protein phosphatase [Lachnospiraceae bacterium]
MVFGYVYEAGLRPNNQDALLVRSTKLSQGELVMAVVCDGMGGEECGEQASYECLQFLDCWFDRELLPVFMNVSYKFYEKRNIIRTKGNSAFYQINRKLFHMMRKHMGRMGTTVSMLILYGKYYYLFHMGDSRIYFVRSVFGKTQFIQKTTDHAVKHRLQRCLGLNKDYMPDFNYGITTCKNFVLCSDGFSNLFDSDIWSVCLDTKSMTDSGRINRRLKELAEDNMRRGETDNISAVWMKI